MAKHVGLIPSLDGGLYQVNGDKIEVSRKKLFNEKGLLQGNIELYSSCIYDVMINGKVNIKHKLNFVILNHRSLCLIFFCMSFSFSQEVINTNNVPVIYNNALLTKAVLQAHFLKKSPFGDLEL